MRRLALLAALLVAARSARASSSWTGGPNLSSARQNVSATVLPDGRVLVVGGTDATSSTYYPDVQIYDPRTGTFTTGTPLATARMSHSATLLPNGKVLIAGGSNGSALADAKLYDPATDSYTDASTGFIAQAGHSAILLKNGRVLVFGGNGAGADTTTAQLYDPVSNTWSPTGSVATGRHDQAGVLLQDGRVMMIGGSVGATPTASVEVYYSTSGTWSGLASMTNVRYGLAATVMLDGRVLASGGFKSGGYAGSAPVEIYNPTTNLWTAATGMPNSGSFNVRQYFTQTLLPDGRVIAVAGDSGGGTPAQFNGTEIYDPIANTWTTGPNLATARYNHISALLPDGKIFVAGGYGGAVALQSVEVLDTPPAAFASGGSLATGRLMHTATALGNGKVLVAGGQALSSNPALSSTELYDPSLNLWSAAAPMGSARLGHTATLLPNGHVLVAGGTDNSGTTYSSAEDYDVPPNLWKPATPMSTARNGHAAVLLPTGRVLVAGGRDGGGTYLRSAELYDFFSRSFAPTGSMTTARSLMSMVVLPGGQALAIGGQTTGGAATGAVERYDAYSQTWTSAASLNTAVFGAAAVVLPSGKVLVAGGDTAANTPTTASEIYDPSANTWTNTAGALNTARESPVMTLLPNGKVLLAGGFSGGSAQSSAEVFDPASGVWVNAPSSLTTARSAHTQTLLLSGKVLVAGGQNTGGSGQTAAELAGYSEFDVFNTTNPARPVVFTINSAPLVPTPLLTPGGVFQLDGSTFTGVSGANGGSSFHASQANLPRAYLRALGGGMVDISTSIYGSGASSEEALFSTSSLSASRAFVTIPPNINCGLYGLRIQSDAYPSSATVVRVAPGPGSSPPGAPGLVYNLATAIGVNWGASGDGNVFSYVLSYSSDNYATGPQISSAATAGLQTSALAGGSRFSPSELWANTTYFFRVADENCGGLGPQSAVTTIVTRALPVTGGFETAASATSAQLSWSVVAPAPSSATAVGFSAEASTAADFTGVVLSSVEYISSPDATNTLTIAGLGLGTTNYFYRVGSLNWAGNPNYGPQAQITSPKNGGAEDSVTSIQGVALATPLGFAAPISTIKITIQRLSDNQYWNGSAFASAVPFQLTAVYSGGPSSGTWSYSDANLPTALTNAVQYDVRAAATDVDGTPTALPGESKFTFDVDLPVASIAQPVDGQISLNSFPTISGTASDPTSSVAGVNVRISSAPGFSTYWNGASFGSAPTDVPATVTGAGAWTLSGPLPAGALLASGVTYRIEARAVDAANNISATPAVARIAYVGVNGGGSFATTAVAASVNGQSESPLAMAYDPSGPFTYIVGVTTTTQNPQFSPPVGLFYYRYNASGALAGGPIQLKGDSTPAAVAVDGAGNTYVAVHEQTPFPYGSVFVQKFDNTMVPSLSVTLDPGQIGSVSAMTSDGTNIFLAASGGSVESSPKTLRMNSSLVVQTTATYTSFPFWAGHGEAIAVAGDGTELYVEISSSNLVTRRLLKYNVSTLSLLNDLDVTGEAAFAPSLAVSTDSALVYMGAYDVTISSRILVSAFSASSGLNYIKTSTTTGATNPFFSFAPVSLGVSPIGGVFAAYTDAYDGPNYPGYGDYTVIKFDRDLNFQLSHAFDSPAHSTDVAVALSVIDSSDVVVTGASFNGHDLDATTLKMYMPGNMGANIGLASQDLGSSTIAVNGNDVPMLSVGLWSQNGLPGSLNSLTINLTGNAPSGNVQANWYQDTNNNGSYDPGVDQLLSSATFGAATPPSVTLTTGAPQAISATTSYFFVTVTYSSVTIGRSIGVAIPFPNAFGLSSAFIGPGAPFPIASTQGRVQMSLLANPQNGAYQIPTQNPNATGGLDTGLPIGLGQIVVVTASGTWKPSAYGVMTASGIPTLGGLDSSLRIGSLVGRVGGGQWFQLSTSAVVTANQTGDLYLAMNDTVYLSTAETGSQVIGVQVLASTAPRVWLGNSGINTNASINANWKNGIPPGTGDIVLFDGSASNQPCNWDLYNANVSLLTLATSYTGAVFVSPSAIALTVSSNVTVAGGGLVLGGGTALIAQTKAVVKSGLLDLGSGPGSLILGSGGLSVDGGVFRAQPTSAAGLTIGAIDPRQQYPISIAQTGSGGAVAMLGGAGPSFLQIHDLSTLSIGTRAVVSQLSYVNFDGSFYDPSPRVQFTGTWISSVAFNWDHLGFDLETSTNVDASALTSGSTVTITNSIGQHFGSIFAKDPNKIISWLPDGGATGTIQGTLSMVTGNGAAPGVTFYIAYARVPNSADHQAFFEALPGATSQIFVAETTGGTGAYPALTLPAPNTYYMMAWRTAAPNGFPQSFDALGGYTQPGIFKASPVYLPAGGSITNADIQIRDWSAVSGLVTNNSPQFGNIVIQAWNGTPHVGDLLAAVTLPPLPSGLSAPYSIAVPATDGVSTPAGSLNVMAFVDVNGDGSQEPFEAQGTSVSLTAVGLSTTTGVPLVISGGGAAPGGTLFVGTSNPFTNHPGYVGYTSSSSLDGLPQSMLRLDLSAAVSPVTITALRVDLGAAAGASGIGVGVWRDANANGVFDNPYVGGSGDSSAGSSFVPPGTSTTAVMLNETINPGSPKTYFITVDLNGDAQGLPPFQVSIASQSYFTMSQGSAAAQGVYPIQTSSAAVKFAIPAAVEAGDDLTGGVDTGIDLQDGLFVAVSSITGLWRADSATLVPGTGDPATSGLNTISPDANYGQLIARIGNDSGDTTDWFPVEADTAFGPSGFQGHVYLAMNDYAGAYFDNSGVVFSTFALSGSTSSSISGTITYTGSHTTAANLVVTAEEPDPNCPNCPNRTLTPRGSSVVIPLNGSQTQYPYTLTNLPVNTFYVISAQNDSFTPESGTSDWAVKLGSVSVSGIDFRISAGQGGISGNINYGGVETFGNFQLAVATVPNIDGNTFFFGGVTQANASVYSITGLPTPATYYLVGYRDVNGDGSPDGPEPFGYIGASGPFQDLASNLAPIFLDSAATQGSTNVTLGDSGALEGGVTLAAAVPSGNLVVQVGRGLPGAPGYAVENTQIYDVSGFAAGDFVGYEADLLRPSTGYSVFAFVSTDFSNVFQPGDSFGVTLAPEVVAGGFSGADVDLSIPGPPAAVTNFRGQALAQTQVRFSWNTAPGAASYTLLTSSGGLVVSLPDPTSYYVQYVSTNTQATIVKIRGVNGFGNGALSSIAPVAGLADPTGQPFFSGLNPIRSSSATLTISAGANPSLTAFTLLRATSATGPFVVTVPSTTQVGVLESGLLPSTSYWWETYATNIDGFATPVSPSTNTLTLPPSGPSIGGTVSYAGRQTGLIAVQISTVASFSPLSAAFTLTPQASQGYYASLPPSQTYNVRAFVDVFGDGQLHQGEDATISSQAVVGAGPVSGFNLTLSADAVAPAAPVGLSVTTPFGQDALSWRAPTVNADGTALVDLAGYRVYRATAATQAFTPITSAVIFGATATVAAVSFVDTAPVAGVANLYRVTAVDYAGNESLASPAISATPFFGGSLSGSVSDLATQNAGPLRVRLSTAAFGVGSIAETTINPFTFQNLPDGVYYVTAFRDLNADSKQQDNEPAGTVGGLAQPFGQQIFGGNAVTGLTATVCDHTAASVGQGTPTSYVVTTSASGCPALDQGPGFFTNVLTFRVGNGAQGSVGVGANMTIQMRSPFPNRLIVLGPDGGIVAQNSDPGGASISLSPSKAGLYSIEPTSFNPGDVGDSTVTLVTTGGFGGVITGTAAYSGLQTGKYVIQFFNSPDPTSPPFLQVSTANPNFTVGGFADGIYYARAYRDANASFTREPGEPSGFFGASVSSLTAISIQGGVERVGGATNAPVNIVLTDPAVGTVSGNIVRQGTQSGPIVIFIGAPNCATCSDVTVAQSTTIFSAGAYTLSFVPPATNYYLEAFVDVNGNGKQDPLEARGSKTPVTVQTGLTTTVNLLVADPGSGASGNATIQGVVSYAGASTGPLLMGFATDSQFQNIAYLLSQPSVGTFVKSGIVGGTSYYIAAFLDTNNNGEPDTKQGEPLGFYGASPSNDFNSMQPVYVPSAGSTSTAITLADAPDGVINGQVVYNGSQFIGKPLIVKAFVGGGNNGDFHDQSFTIPNVSSGVIYPYKLPYLAASSSFTVFAFIDANGNNSNDFGEPDAYYGQTTCQNGFCSGSLVSVSSGIGLPTYGINVFVQDPGTQGGTIQNTGALDLEADYLGSQGGPIVFRAFTNAAMTGSPYRTLSVSMPPGPGNAGGKLTNLPFGTYYVDAFRDPAGSGVYNPAFDAYGSLGSATLQATNNFQRARSQNGIVDPGQGGSVNVYSGSFAAPGGARFDGGAVDIAAGIAVDSVSVGGPYLYVEGVTKQNAGVVTSLVKYSSAGVFMASTTLQGGEDGVTIYAVDNAGNLYLPGQVTDPVTNDSTATITKLAPSLATLQTVLLSSGTGIRSLVMAGGSLYAAVEGQGNSGQLVVKYDPNTFVALATGTFLFPSAAFGGGCSNCNGGDGGAVAVDPAGDVYVVAFSNFNPGMSSSLIELLKFAPGLGSPVAQTDITSLVPNTGDHQSVSLGVDAAGEAFLAVVPSGDSNAHTYKFSPSLQLQNSATFGPVLSHFSGGLRNLVVASTDNYVYEAWESKSNGGDMVALRYDTNLNLLAQRTFDGLDNAHEDFAFDLGVLNSSNVYLTGGATNAKGDLDWATVRLNMNSSGAQSGAGAVVSITTANAVNAIYGNLSYAGTLITSGTVRSALFPLGQQTPIRFSSAPFGANVPYLFNNVPAGSYQVQAFIDPNGSFSADAGEPVGISSSAGFAFAATTNVVLNVQLCDRRAIAFGQTIQTTIAPPDCRAADQNGAMQRLFTFSGTRGQPVTIQADAINFVDVPVRLYDPSGALIMSADGGSGSSLINSFILPLDGLYTIGVSPFSTSITSATVKLALGGGAGSLGSVSGNVGYNGVEGGKIVMALFSTSTFLAGGGAPVQIQSLNAAGPFTFSNLLTGSTYYLGAFIDVNANGRPDAGEDLGFFGSTTTGPAPILLRSGQNAAGVNFTISPSSAAVFADLAGVISYAGQQTGSMHVELWSSAQFSGQPSAARVIPTGAGAYDVPAPGNLPYYVRAWLDANGDGVLQASEPVGVYAPLNQGAQAIFTPSSGTVFGVNFSIVDPGQLAGGVVGEGSAAISPSTAPAGAQVFSATITYTAGAAGLQPGATIGITVPAGFPPPNASLITVTSTATATFSAIKITPSSFFAGVTAGGVTAGQQVKFVYTEGPVSCVASTQTWAVSESQNGAVAPQPLLAGSPSIQVVQGAPVVFQPNNPYLSLTQNVLSDAQYMIARDACGNQSVSTFTATVALRAKRFDPTTSQFVFDPTVGVSTSVLTSTAASAALTFNVGQSSQPFYALSASTGSKNLETFFNLGSDTTFYYGLTALPGNALTNVSVSSVSFGVGQSSVTINPAGSGASLAFVNFTLGDPSQSWHVAVASVPFKSAAAGSPVWESWGVGQPNRGQIAWDGRYSPWINGGARVPSGFYYVRVEIGGVGGVHDDSLLISVVVPQLSGQFRDAGLTPNPPISGALAQVYGPNGTVSAQSDGSGNYVLAGLSAGTYNMFVSRQDFLNGTASFTIDATGAVSTFTALSSAIGVSTNAAGGLDVLMGRAAVLFVTPSFSASYSTAAADQYGSLQVAATTTLAAANQQSYFSGLHVAAGTSTIDDGGQWDPSANQFIAHTSFKFTVAPGTYTASAFMPGFSVSTASIYVANGLNSLALPAFAPKSSVSGTVTLPSAAPAPNGVFVSLAAVASSTAAAAAGGGSGVQVAAGQTTGSYTIFSLDAGSYTIRANANGYSAASTPVFLPVSSSVANVNLTLGAGAAIGGNVTVNANTLGATLSVNVSAWAPAALSFGSTNVYHAGANGLVTIPYTISGLSGGAAYQLFVNVGGTNASLIPQTNLPLTVTAPSAAANVAFAASSGAISGTIILPSGATDFADVSLSGVTIASARPDDVGHTFFIPSSTEIAQGSGGFFLCQPGNVAPNATDGTCPPASNTATFLVSGMNTETDDVTFFYKTTGQSQKVRVSVVSGSTTTAKIDLSPVTYSIAGSINNQITNSLFNTNPLILANSPLIPLRDASGNIVPVDPALAITSTATTARVLAIKQDISQFNLAISTSFDPVTSRVGFLTAAGTFTITNVPSGVYYVRSVGLRLCSTCAVSVPAVGQLVNVAGASVSSVTLTLSDGYSVAGTISLDGGLQDARVLNVTVVNQRQEVAASTQVYLGDVGLGVTANSVSYSFANLPANNFYTLTVLGNNVPHKYVGKPLKFPNPALSPNGLQSNLTAQNVTLQRAAYFTGRMQDANTGQLIDGNSAGLLAPNFQIAATAVPWIEGGFAQAPAGVLGRPIQADGTFLVGPLIPGVSYALKLGQQSWDPSFLASGSQNYTPVVLSGLTPQAGQIMDVGVVSLNQGQSLSGTVFASTTTGPGLGNILVTAQPTFGNSGVTIQTYTNPNGRYTLWVSTYISNQYDVTAAARGGNLASNGTFYTQVTLHAVNLLATTTADFVLNPLQVSVTGQVLLADAATGGALSYPFGAQKGFPAAAIFMQPQGVVPTQNPLGDIAAISDSLGAFTVPGLSTGTYSLRVVSLGYAVFNATVTASTSTYVVYTGANLPANYLPNNTITLQRGATVTGRIVKSDGSAPNTSEVGGIAAANFASGEFVIGSVDSDPVAKTVNSYTISGFKTGVVYNIVILPADKRDDVLSPVEGQGVSFQTLESTTTKNINLTFNAAAMTCVATAKGLGNQQFQVKIDCNKDLRNVTAADSDLSQILTVSTYTSAGQALIAPNGTGQLNGGDKKISADRKEITAIYRAATNETSFSLRLRAAASTVDPKSGLNFATDQVFDFFTGLASNVTNRVQNANGGSIELEPSAQDELLGTDERSRIDLLPGTFAIGDASLPDSAVTASATTTITVGLAKAQDQQSASVLALHNLGYVPSSLNILSNPSAFPAELGAAMAKAGVLGTSTSTIGGANPLSSFYNIFLPLGVRHQLKQRADITFSYNTLTSTAANNPDSINIWFYNATLGQFVLESTNRRLDQVNKTITVSVDHFSVFVVLDGKPAVQAPNATPFSEIIAYNFPNPSDCGVHSSVQTDTALAPTLGATFQPFKGTMIRYSLPPGPSAGVTLRFYNLAGQLVKTIDQGEVQGGFTNYQNWDCTNNSGRQVASGVYVGEIQWGKQRKFFKTAIIRGSGL